MPHILLRPCSQTFVFACVFAVSTLPALSKDKTTPDYPQTGKVLSAAAKGAHIYQVETEDKVFTLLCQKTSGHHFTAPECKIDDKPIAVGDALHFRVDGDSAYMPLTPGKEENLRILTTDLKVIPPIGPAASENGKPGTEAAMVIGTGMHIAGQRAGAWSTTPGAGGFGPVMATGPITAIPVTGGAPILVIPMGPVGGVVTGVPVTGGAPITAIPMGGAPAGGMHPGGAAIGGGGGPIWVHLLRLQAGNKTYQLECSRKSCEIDGKNINLGDTLTLRVDKKWAYVTFTLAPGTKEQKLRILNEKDDVPEPVINAPVTSQPSSAPAP